MIILRTFFFLVFCATLMVSACAKNAVLPDVSKQQLQKITSPYVIEKKNLPEVVHRLFYAVKDSLDYASVTGGINGALENLPDEPLPKKALEEYERVTDGLLKEFNSSFIVEKYVAEEWDYELIVQNRKNINERYKATRVQMFRFDEGEWKALGVYLHW